MFIYREIEMYAPARFANAPHPKSVELFSLTVDTESSAFCKLTLRRKLEGLKSSLTKISGIISQKDTQPGQTIKAILVAPEYFFQKIHKPEKGKSRQYSEDFKRFIEMELTQLSHDFPGILIIAGTIAWKKNMLSDPQTEENIWGGQQPDITQALGRIPTAQKLSFKHYSYSKVMRGITSDQAKYDQKYMSKSGDHSYLKALEALQGQKQYFFGRNSRDNAPDNSQEHKIDSLLAMRDTPQLRDALLSRNTAYAYLNGKRVHKYHKGSDYQEVIDQGQNFYVSGTKSPIIPPNLVDGMRIGMEICLDHNCGVLAKHLALHQGDLLDDEKAPLDIHLILSAAVSNQPANQRMKKDGYLIHSSSREHDCLYQDGSGKKLLANQINRSMQSVTLFFGKPPAAAVPQQPPAQKNPRTRSHNMGRGSGNTF